MEKKFKVGDRVIVNGEVDGVYFENEKGEVIECMGSILPYLVKFDKKRDELHDALGKCKDGHGWWCNPQSMKLDVQDTKPKFNVGDRVIVNGNQSGKTFNNEAGVLKQVNNIDCLVEFDNNIGGHSGGGRGKDEHCWWINYDNVKLEIEETKPQFKIGDRVRVKDTYPIRRFAGKLATYKAFNGSHSHLLEFDEFVNGHGGYGEFTGKDGHCRWLSTKEFEPYKDEKIVIYREGNKVIAKNLATKKTAKAKCHADDTFDFKIGAKLAFERLFEEPKSKYIEEFEEGKTYVFDLETFHSLHPKEDSSWVYACVDRTVTVSNSRDGWIDRYSIDPKWCKEVEKPKYYNGKVVCVDNKLNTKSLTIGKIYEFVDGQFIDNLGDYRPYHHGRVKSLDDFHNCGCVAKFIEVVE